MTEANKMRQHLLVDECALLDLASSACQEALAFGVNENAFERLARSVEFKCQDGMPAAARDVVSERLRQVNDEATSHCVTILIATRSLLMLRPVTR